MVNCVISNNWSPYGGGVLGCTLTNCNLIANSGGGLYVGEGGGAYSSTLYNCLLLSNSTVRSGGAAAFSTLNNCTVVSNTANGSGGGVDFTTLNNCIVFYNSAPSQPNYSGTNPIIFSCTTPLPAGAGNISNAPRFAGQVSGNFRLQPRSPCVNAGSNLLA